MDPRLQAWVIAHRATLAYLVKAVHTALPPERDAADQTVAMLPNTVAAAFARYPASLREEAIAVAQQEIDRIFTAPCLPAARPDP